MFVAWMTRLQEVNAPHQDSPARDLLLSSCLYISVFVQLNMFWISEFYTYLFCYYQTELG